MRERWNQELERSGPQALHALLARRAPWAAATIDPADRHRIVRALELEEIGALEPPEGESQLWSAEVRHPTRLVGLVMAREALYARIDRRVDAMVAAGVIDEVRAAHRAGASITARAALGFDELLAGDVDAMKRRTRNYAQAPADMDAQARRGRAPRRRRALARRAGRRAAMIGAAMRFEKWQALGNDYLIVELGRAPVGAHPGARPPPMRPPSRGRLGRDPAARAERGSAPTSRGCGSSTPTAPRPSCPATAPARPSCTCAAAATSTPTSSRS